MALKADAEEYYPSETALSTLSSRYRHVAARKYPCFKKSNSTAKNVNLLRKINYGYSTHAELFHVNETPVEQFSFVEFYRNKNFYDSKYKSKCLNMCLNGSTSKKYASSSDILRFASHLPFMQNESKSLAEQNKGKDSGEQTEIRGSEQSRIMCTIEMRGSRQSGGSSKVTNVAEQSGIENSVAQMHSGNSVLIEPDESSASVIESEVSKELAEFSDSNEKGDTEDFDESSESEIFNEEIESHDSDEKAETEVSGDSELEDSDKLNKSVDSNVQIVIEDSDEQNKSEDSNMQTETEESDEQSESEDSCEQAESEDSDEQAESEDSDQQAESEDSNMQNEIEDLYEQNEFEDSVEKSRTVESGDYDDQTVIENSDKQLEIEISNEQIEIGDCYGLTELDNSVELIGIENFDENVKTGDFVNLYENLTQFLDKSKDFFDDATMEHVRHHLLQLSSIESVVTSGPPSAITFHSTVTGRRINEAGKVHFLLHWSPENIVPDTWVTEEELCHNAERTIPVSQLPPEALQLPVMDALGLSGIFSRPGKRKRK